VVRGMNVRKPWAVLGRLWTDGISFEEKTDKISSALYEQFAETGHFEAVIRKNLEVLGYGISSRLPTRSALQ